MFRLRSLAAPPFSKLAEHADASGQCRIGVNDVVVLAADRLEKPDIAEELV
jgi:hypothetical protein